MIDPTGPLRDWADFGVALGGLVVVLASWWRWGRPRLKRTTAEMAAVRDAILGREAIQDSITGATIAPALPGIGVRTANLERALEMLTVTVQKLTDQNAAVANLQVSVERIERHVDACDARTQVATTAIADLQKRTRSLEEAAIERVATRVESTAAWSAVEAAAKAKPDAAD